LVEQMAETMAVMTVVRTADRSVGCLAATKADLSADSMAGT
jgi:hypothetical protein